MAKQFADLSMLPVNKTVVFYSPVEGEDVLVRTGTIAEGSCFYHALLHAHSPQYVQLNDIDRKEHVKKLRASLSKLDRDSWESTGDGTNALLAFQEQVNKLLNGFYNYFKSRSSQSVPRLVSTLFKYIVPNDSDAVALQLLIDTLSLEQWEKHILPPIFSTKQNKTIDLSKKCIESQALTFYAKELAKFGTALDRARVKYLLKYLKRLIRTICELAEKEAYNVYTSNIKDVTEAVDETSIALISDRFNRDIYFIDASNSRLPYRIGGMDNIKGRKTIILLWVGRNHYEVVGRLLPGNRVQREFSPGDSLIKRLHTYLFYPENISSEYPTLTPYIPRAVNTKMAVSSDDENEDDDDIDSDHGRSPDYGRSPSRAAHSPEGSVISDW